MVTKDKSRNKTKTNERYEKLKEDILNWKQNHAEEYNRFARAMRSGEALRYIPLYNFLMKEFPEIRKEYEKNFNEDSNYSLDNLRLDLYKKIVPSEIIEVIQIKENPKRNWVSRLFNHLYPNSHSKVSFSVPLLLSWMYYGKSFESMIETLESLMNQESVHVAEKEKLYHTIEIVIESSIKNGFRTIEDWEDYFKQARTLVSVEVSSKILDEIKNKINNEKLKTEGSIVDENKENGEEATEEIITQNLPGRRKGDEGVLLEDYLKAENKKSVIELLRKFVLNNNTGILIGLTYYALKELDLFNRAIQIKEYSNAIYNQFSDIENLVKPNSIRQDISKLKKRDKFVIIDGKSVKGSLIESDEYSTMLEKLKKEIMINLKISS